MLNAGLKACQRVLVGASDFKNACWRGVYAFGFESPSACARLLRESHASNTQSRRDTLESVRWQFEPLRRPCVLSGMRTWPVWCSFKWHDWVCTYIQISPDQSVVGVLFAIMTSIERKVNASEYALFYYASNCKSAPVPQLYIQSNRTSIVL